MACLAARTLGNGTRPICATRSRRRQHVVAVASSFQDPYTVLGVPATADETEIKRAYRSMAKQHHPDVSKAEGSSMVFLQLTEAYDFLLGKLRGGRDGTDASPSGGWDWHDWYWNFRINRTWRKQQQGSSEAPPQARPAAASTAPNIREQLAGLRQRAAIRATKARNSRSGATSSVDSCSTLEEEEEAWQPEAEGRAYAASASANTAAAAAPAVATPAAAAMPATAATAAASQGGWAHTASMAAAPCFSHQEAGCRHEATGPSVSHHVPVQQQQQQQHAFAAYASHQASGQQEQQQQQASAFTSAAPQKRKFVAHSGTRANVQHQLAGLRRKAMITKDLL